MVAKGGPSLLRPRDENFLPRGEELCQQPVDPARSKDERRTGRRKESWDKRQIGKKRREIPDNNSSDAGRSVKKSKNFSRLKDSNDLKFVSRLELMEV